MRYISLCCVLFLTFVFVISFPVLAQSRYSSDVEYNIPPRKLNNWKNRVPLFTEKYNNLVKEIYANPKDAAMKVKELRSYYPFTEQYSPFSKSVLDEVTRYAMEFDNALDNNVANDALLSYNELVAKHLVNFDILSFAFTMARLDPRFGDEWFYRRVRDALIDSFYQEGIGTRAENAYYIVTYGEETYILEQIGGIIKSSEIYEVNDRYYNVHEVVDNNDNYRQVFMDVTQPIRNLIYRKRLKDIENKLSIKPLFQ